MTALVRAAALHGFVPCAKACGIDPIPLLRRRRLLEASQGDGEALIPYLHYIQLLEDSALASGCADFGMRFADAYGLERIGMVSLLIQHAATLGDALRLASRYLFVHSPSIHLDIVPVAGQPDWVDLCYVLDLHGSVRLDQALELAVCTIVQSVTRFGQSQIRPCLVRFPHARLGSVHSYERYLQCPCEFGAPVSAVRLAVGSLSQPMPAGNGELQALAHQYLSRHFPNPSQPLGDRVRVLLGRLLGNGMANQRDVAHLLGVHPRTLQRRLAAEGLVFAEILDIQRRERLAKLLSQSEPPPFVQVAWMLDYSEPASLNRACQRWFGQAPGGLMRHLQSADDVTVGRQ